MELVHNVKLSDMHSCRLHMYTFKRVYSSFITRNRNNFLSVLKQRFHIYKVYHFVLIWSHLLCPLGFHCVHAKNRIKPTMPVNRLTLIQYIFNSPKMKAERRDRLYTVFLQSQQNWAGYLCGKLYSKAQVCHEVSFSEEAPTGRPLFISALTVWYGQDVDPSHYFIPDHTTPYQLKPSGRKDWFVIITCRAQKI